MKISGIPDVRIAKIDVQMMRCVGEWIVTKIERHYHSGQNSFHAYGERKEPQQNAHQTIQIIRVVGRIITVIFKISPVKENTFSISINDILGHDFAIIPSNIFITVRNKTITCERSSDDKWKICPAYVTIVDVKPENENCKNGTNYVTNGSYVKVKGMCGGEFTVYYQGKMTLMTNNKKFDMYKE